MAWPAGTVSSGHVMSEIAEQLRKAHDAVRASGSWRFCRTLPDDWEARFIAGSAVPRQCHGRSANYCAACRARSRREFIDKLGMVVDESDEAVFWLTFDRAFSGMNQRRPIKGVAFGKGENCWRSLKSARRRENRQRKAASRINKLAIYQFANSPIYRRPSMISSSASGPGRVRLSGSVASGSSTTLSWVRKSSRSGSM